MIWYYIQRDTRISCSGRPLLSFFIGFTTRFGSLDLIERRFTAITHVHKKMGPGLPHRSCSTAHISRSLHSLWWWGEGAAHHALKMHLDDNVTGFDYIWGKIICCAHRGGSPLKENIFPNDFLPCRAAAAAARLSLKIMSPPSVVDVPFAYLGDRNCFKWSALWIWERSSAD